MDYDTEIRKLSGETFALQTLVVSLCIALIKHDTTVRQFVSRAFDYAASQLEDLTIQAGEAVPPEHLAHSLRVVEELRTATLGNQDEPKHGV